jgi:hypothetical protein
MKKKMKKKGKKRNKEKKKKRKKEKKKKKRKKMNLEEQLMEEKKKYADLDCHYDVIRYKNIRDILLNNCTSEEYLSYEYICEDLSSQKILNKLRSDGILVIDICDPDLRKSTLFLWGSKKMVQQRLEEELEEAKNITK